MKNNSTNIVEINNNYWFIQRHINKPSLIAVSPIFPLIVKELNSYYPNLLITKTSVIYWIIFLFKSEKLMPLIIAIYFKYKNVPIDYDLSSYVKIQTIKIIE